MAADLILRALTIITMDASAARAEAVGVAARAQRRNV